MVNLTSEEALQERIKQLGESAGKFVRNLETDLYSLRILWRKYVCFFGTSSERVDLMNAISGSSTYWIERCMFESAMLSICRLTDPETHRKGKGLNISVRCLPSFSRKGKDQVLDDLIDVAINKTEFARSWRNKRIAHSDNDARNGLLPMPTASRLLMRQAMDAIAACIKRFALIEFDTTLIIHPIGDLANDEVAFVEALFLGKRELDLRGTKKRQLLEEHRYNEIDELEKLPDWVSYRPQDEIDV
jgi:hypothetical protein